MAKTQKDYIFAVGRRKTANARVRLYSKKGENKVNGKPIESYFPGELAKAEYLKPLRLTDTEEKFSFSAKIMGSGLSSQLDALIHGIARALSKADVDLYRPVLKSDGLLTRDPRQKERRKVGTGGKARRKKQSPKR